ncbi:MAG: hypothetical protein RLZ98_2197 [Pseudomonadota bacterium]|jgi:tripartite-type tricarboxylate transporter receptor subunit TctC
MKKLKTPPLLRLLAALTLSAVTATQATADEFYKGRSVQFIISAGVAGGYAAYARTLISHMPNHIPGKPDFVFQSMPGAGGLRAANFFYGQAPKDGSVFGMVHSGVPLAPLLGTQGARFETLKFNWIGSMDRKLGPCTAWHTAPVKTWNDMLTKEFIVGSSGAGSQMESYPAAMNKLFGTKIKIISGYKDGASIYQAMERGEVHGRCGPQLTSITSLRPQWLTEKLITVPILVGERRAKQFPDSPTLLEFAKDEMTRQVVRLLTVSQDLDRPVLAPPGVPAERVALLRSAFNATMQDRAFNAAIEKQKLTLDWVGGDEVAKTLAAAYSTPADVVAVAKQIMGSKEKPKK